MQYIQLADVVAFNQQLIDRYTGTHFLPDNIKQPDQLDYLLQLCEDNVVFGEAQYPTVEHIAALVLFKMVNGHYFHDGNKRTALMTMRYFLHLNGYKMKARLQTVILNTATRHYIPRKLKTTSQRIIVELVEELAQPETYALTYDEVLRFVQHNIEPIPNS